MGATAVAEPQCELERDGVLLRVPDGVGLDDDETLAAVLLEGVDDCETVPHALGDALTDWETE